MASVSYYRHFKMISNCVGSYSTPHVLVSCVTVREGAFGYVFPQDVVGTAPCSARVVIMVEHEQLHVHVVVLRSMHVIRT